MSDKAKIADVIVGVMMVPLGLLSLLLASRAMDAEMNLFGMSLAGFAAVFGFGILKEHFDHADRVRVASAQDEKVLVSHG